MLKQIVPSAYPQFAPDLMPDSARRTISYAGSVAPASPERTPRRHRRTRPLPDRKNAGSRSRGRARERPHRRDRSISRRRCGGACFSRPDASKPLAFPGQGTCYVYFAYGSCWMMNVSSEGGRGGCRSSDPRARSHRGHRDHGAQSRRVAPYGPYPRARAAGPGDANRQSRWTASICAPPRARSGWQRRCSPPAEIGVTTRIGLSREAHRLLRFYERAQSLRERPEVACSLSRVQAPKPQRFSDHWNAFAASV